MAKTIAAYGGGFKPPTSGHFEVVKTALKQNPEIDEFIIYVGGGERDGITQAEAVLIWEIYQTYLPMKVKIEPSKAPIGDVVRLGKNNPQDTVYFVIGGREGREDDMKDIESRTKGIEDKYPNMKIKIIQTPDQGMSGTNARKAAKVSPEEFYKYLPTELKDEEKEEVYNIVKPAVKESLNENASYSSDIDYKEHIKELTKYMIEDGWNILPLPKVVFKHGDSENARDFFGKTAYYDPNTQTIVLYTEGRHPKDIVRSFSHEMVHHEQNLEGRLGDIATTNTQEDDKLNDIEKEANLNGTMTFRNWTDSLQEKKKKDHFGLDQYARELAQGLEEALSIGGKEVERIDKPTNNPEDAVVIYKDGTTEPYLDIIKEGRKKKKDPKKGTGKKPKGSSRRLYTDEDPKDTVGVSFRTKEDIVDTLNKKSFKAKSHARQSQIINLIHQRVRAAYGRAKDPETKARLKRGLDYIEKRKEASKEKTQRLKNQKKKTNENLNIQTKPKMLFEERLAYYKDYYVNLSPSTFDIVTEDGTIVIGGFDKPYPINFNDTKDIRQVPVNENVPGAKDDGKAAPYGSGYKKMNEGAYDSIVSKLSKDVLNAWKSQFDDNPKRLFSLLDTSYEFEDAKGRPMDFEFLAKLDFKKTKDRQYKVDGGANEGDDETEGFVALNFQVDPRELPRMWSTIAMDIRDVLRHELEHLTQGGWNVRMGKEMEDDQFIRDLIQKYKTLAPKNYFMLDKEVDAMLQGMYFKAKKSRTPFADVIEDYLDKVGLDPEEKEEIKTRWRGRIKALSLPLFEELEEMEYEIYSDMDGVITDFDASFMKASDGIRPSEYERNMGKDKFWELIDGKGVGYWVGMPWMPDGKQYWDYIKQYNPILLSSPSRSSTSRLGKRLWVRNNLPGTKLILAQAKDKQNYARKNRILIDDRPSNIEEWRSQGGIGILHTSASNTIRQLKELGL